MNSSSHTAKSPLSLLQAQGGSALQCQSPRVGTEALGTSSSLRASPCSVSGPSSPEPSPVHQPQGTSASQVPTGAGSARPVFLATSSQRHDGTCLPACLPSHWTLGRKRWRVWEHDTTGRRPPQLCPWGPPASPWAAVTGATSPAHGLLCRPQQRGNLRPACASRWGPAGSGPRGPLGTQPRGACRLSCTPLGVVSPTPPAHRSRGFGGVWGGVTQGASVAGSCPTAPQSWRPETPGQGVGRGGPFRSSEEASVPGPPPAPGDSRPPLASLASTSLPHGAGLSPCLVFLSTCAHPSDLVLT